MRPGAGVVAAGLLLCRAAVAYADPLTPETAAPAKRLDVCIATFEEAQRKEHSSDLRQARRLYGECASSVCPKQLQDDCIRGRDALDRALPTAIFVVRDPAGLDVQATFKVDGQALRTAPGRAAPLDPGEHIVEASLAGGQTITTKIVVNEGEKSRVIVLSSNGAAPSSPSAERRGLPIGPIVLASAAGVTFLVGVGFFVRFLSLRSDQDDAREEFEIASADYQRSPSAAGTPENQAKLQRRTEAGDEYNRLQEELPAPLLTSVALGAVGLAAGGAALIWHNLTRPTSTNGLFLLPSTTPTFAGATLHTTF